MTTPGGFQFDQGVVGPGLVHRDVDDQPGRLEVVQQVVDLVSQLRRSCRRSGRPSSRG